MADQKPQKEVVRMAGFIFIYNHTDDKTKFFMKAKKKLLVQLSNDPLAKVKEYMAQHGLLSHFMKSLEPENRQTAWE